MKDARKTKAQLITELRELRAKLADFDRTQQGREATDELTRSSVDITNPKQTDEALARERNLLRTLVDNLPDYVFVKDEQSRFVLNNAAHLALLKAKTQDEVSGKTDFDIFPEELAAQYYADEQRVIQSGESLVNREEAVVDEKGQRQWLLTSKVPLCDSDGTPTGIVGISRNITKRRLAEEALHRSEAKYHNLVDCMPDVVWRTDAQGRFTFVSAVAKRLVGYDPDELLGASFDKVLTEESVRQVVQFMEQRTDGEASPEDTVLELSYRRKDGTEFFGELHTQPILDESGSVLETQGITRDITGHRKIEEALARERNLLRTVIENLPDYIYAKDAKSRFILNNAAHLALLRAKTQGEVAGKTDYDIFPQNLAARYYVDEQAVIKSGEPLVNREEEVVNEQGRRQWLLTTKVPLLDDDGRPAGIVGMSRNITERKEMEQALEERSKLLERANADLEMRNQELDEFTYVASHDLQEPLRKLVAFSGVLNEDMVAGDKEEVAHDLQVISSAAFRMQALVQDLLSLSRSGRQSMKLESVRLDECVDRALDALELRVEETGGRIVRCMLPVVRGDLSLLTQLYQNLIGNALKFFRSESPRIELSAEKAGAYWVLGVRDNGIGLKPEYAEQIFSPFKRLHRRGEYEGTGIGLAICRKIAERHDGKIWVESSLGKGAHFKFTIAESQGDHTS